MQHTIPISTNFKAFKFFSITMGGNYQETWALKTNRYFDFNEVDGVVIEEIKGFDRFAKYSYSASMTTKIYGTLNFKPDNKIQSIRHVITPSISYSNSPSFEKYYDKVWEELKQLRRMDADVLEDLVGNPNIYLLDLLIEPFTEYIRKKKESKSMLMLQKLNIVFVDDRLILN